MTIYTNLFTPSAAIANWASKTIKCENVECQMSKENSKIHPLLSTEACCAIKGLLQQQMTNDKS